MLNIYKYTNNKNVNFHDVPFAVLNCRCRTGVRKYHITTKFQARTTNM